MEPSATSTTVTKPEGALLLDCPVPLRCFNDSGTGYKYSDLLTYLLH